MLFIYKSVIMVSDRIPERQGITWRTMGEDTSDIR